VVLVDTDCLLLWASLSLARRLEEGSTSGTEVENSLMGLSKASAKTATVFPYSFENGREKKAFHPSRHWTPLKEYEKRRINLGTSCN